MQTREQIITSMCFTFRHDYGLIKDETETTFATVLSSGMYQFEREALWNTMAQIFDNDILPVLNEAGIKLPLNT